MSKRIIKKSLGNNTKKVLNWNAEQRLKDWIKSL